MIKEIPIQHARDARIESACDVLAKCLEAKPETVVVTYVRDGELHLTHSAYTSRCELLGHMLCQLFHIYEK